MGIARFTIVWPAVGSLALAAALPATASEVIRLEPSGPWNINYADDSCRLARAFGGKENPTLLSFERFDSTDSTQLLVSGDVLGTAKRETVTVQFGPIEQAAEYTAMVGKFPGFGPALLIVDARFDGWRPDPDDATDVYDPPDFPEDREATIEWIAFERNHHDKVVLATGSLDAPMAAMRQCTDELLTHWGIDVEAHRNLTRSAEPRTSPVSWVDPNDYPSSLANDGYEGIVQFRLIVEKDGTPSSCHIQSSSRPEGFERVTCDSLMRRARFEPALDANGNPIRSYWRSTVRYTLRP